MSKQCWNCGAVLTDGAIACSVCNSEQVEEEDDDDEYIS